tara:strand:- start:47997 stop:48395 length:399 start_codon:yes stop_codon:yes gene_type:complete
MFSKNKKDTKIDLEQHEMLENAQIRIRQKKAVYRHFAIFLIGSVFLVLINKILKYGETYDWFIWAITLWAFIFVVHAVNVLLLKRFMGREWERLQREKLVARQKAKIAALQRETEMAHPMPTNDKKLDSWEG